MCIVRISTLEEAVVGMAAKGGKMCPSPEWHQMQDFVPHLRGCKVVMGNGSTCSKIKAKIGWLGDVGV